MLTFDSPALGRTWGRIGFRLARRGSGQVDRSSPGLNWNPKASPFLRSMPPSDSPPKTAPIDGAPFPSPWDADPIRAEVSLMTSKTRPMRTAFGLLLLESFFYVQSPEREASTHCFHGKSLASKGHLKQQKAVRNPANRPVPHVCILLLF